MKRCLFMMLCTYVAVMILSGTAFAENKEVSTIDDFKKAIEEAGNNDVITITSNLDGSNLTITLKTGVTGVTIQGNVENKENENFITITNLKSFASTNKELTVKNIKFVKNGSTTLVLNGTDITYENCIFKSENGGKLTTMSSANNITLNNCDFIGKTYGSDYLIHSPSVTNLTIDGCTFTNAFSGLYYGYLKGTINVKNSSFDVYAYTTHTGSGGTNTTDLYCENNTYYGWTSHGGELKSCTYKNCFFGHSSRCYYSLIKPYTDATFEECTFEDGFQVDQTAATSKIFTFKDCYWQAKDGTKELITMDNVKELKITQGKLANDTFVDLSKGGTVKANVAKVGETPHVDFEEALKTANESGETLELQANVTTDELSFYYNKLNIDGKNFTWTVTNIEQGEYYALYPDTEGSGVLNVSNLSVDLPTKQPNRRGFDFRSGTIENVKFTGGFNALVLANNNEGDTITIKNNTFTGQTDAAIYFGSGTTADTHTVIITENTFDNCNRVGIMYSPVGFYGNTIKSTVTEKLNFYAAGSKVVGNEFPSETKVGFYHTDTTAYYNKFLGTIEINSNIETTEKLDLSSNYWGSEEGYTLDLNNVLVESYYATASDIESTQTIDGKEYAIKFTLYPAFTKPTVVENFTYDGLSHNLVNNDGVTTEGKFYFALGENATTAPSDGSYSADFPKGTAANTYYIWYRVVGPYSKTDGEFLGSVVIQSIPNDSGGGVVVDNNNGAGNNSNNDNSSDNNSNNNGNGDSNNNSSNNLSEQEINEVVNNVVENMTTEEKETITNINEVLTEEQKTNINDNQLQAIVNELDNLETLDLTGNQNITNVDLSGKENLTSVNLENCDNLQALDVSGCSSLTELEGLTNNTSITKLDASGCENLETLDVSGCENLETLDCSDSALSDLNVEGCSSLQELNCSNNNIESLSVANCEVLETLDCSKNSIANLTVQGCLNLKRLYCYSNNLEKLELPVQRLEWLVCDNNKLQELNVEENRRLQRLDCQNNGMGALEIDRTVFEDLNWLKCYGQRIPDLNIIRNGNNYQVRINDYIRSYSPRFASAGAIVSEVDVINVVDVKGFDKNGNEIEKISYDASTGVVEFAESPAKVSYGYKTGYNGIIMDVTLGEETRERNSNTSDDDNKDNNTNYYGGGSSGCNMGISVIALLACAMFLKKVSK